RPVAEVSGAVVQVLECEVGNALACALLQLGNGRIAHPPSCQSAVTIRHGPSSPGGLLSSADTLQPRRVFHKCNGGDADIVLSAVSDPGVRHRSSNAGLQAVASAEVFLGRPDWRMIDAKVFGFTSSP